MKRDGVCTVSTVRDTGPRLESFIRYHLAIGVRRIFLFFDSPSDAGIRVARRFDAVTVVLPTPSLKRKQRGQTLFEKFGPFVRTPGPTGTVARQILNAETAIAMALEEGLGWIVHLDDDELLSVGRSVDRYFAGFSDDVGQIIHLNHEAAPESANVVDSFKEVTLFKRHPRSLSERGARDVLAPFWRQYYFVSHVKGKAAARVAPGLAPSGCHAFTPSPNHRTTVWAPGDACVLHYAFASLRHMLQRYRSWGAFPLDAPQPWGKRSNDLYDFIVRSRAVYAGAGAAGLTLLHRHHVVYDDPKEIALLLRAGVLLRNRVPATLLRGRAAR
jgi:hypothetical protein